MTSKSQNQFVRWLDGNDESPWQSGFQLASTGSSDNQSPRPDRADEESRLFHLQQESEPEQDVPQELMITENNEQHSETMDSDRRFSPEALTLRTRALRIDNEQIQELSDIGMRRGSDTEDPAGVEETESASLSNEGNEGNETASGVLREDMSTDAPSGSSERFQSQISGEDTESTMFDAKTRWAFLDEERRVENGASIGHASQDFESLALDTVHRPEVPPSIMEQISIIASQYTDSLTEEQYQNWLKRPREMQRQSLRAFFDDLAGLGPWFGVKRRMSQEGNVLGL